MPNQVNLYLYQTEKVGLNVLDPAAEIVLSLGSTFYASGGTSLNVGTTMVAGETISIHKAVVPVGDGTVVYADQQTVAEVGRTLGISYNSANVGNLVVIITSGEIDEPTWNWSPGEVFLGLNGGLTQTPPTTGVLQVVGVAIAPTRLCVGIQLPIILN